MMQRMIGLRRVAVAFAFTRALLAPIAAQAPAGSASSASVRAPTRDYLLYVASEATDEIQLVRFGPAGAKVERRHGVGFNPVEPDGPHGLAVAPDGGFYYVSTAHGAPNGRLWKFRAEDGRSVGQTELGLFPASMQISPDGVYAYVANFNLYGDPVPSSISVVSTNEMVEIARIKTCAMPHGSRLSTDGQRHYSVCMMDDMLIEIDARGFAVSQHFELNPGMEHGMSGPPMMAQSMAGAATGGGSVSGSSGSGSSGGSSGMAGHAMDAPAGGAKRCSPTWAAPSPDGSRVYVACNQANDIVEVDVANWRLVRRIPAGEGVYNLATTRDGKVLIATNRRGKSVSFFDAASGRELAKVATLRPVIHGIAVSDDNRYAFISVEGIGAEPGTVEVIDLATFQRVASVELGQMAGGLDFWKSVAVGAPE
jgi:DNA-binding beta-propeller fold protein YncE